MKHVFLTLILAFGSVAESALPPVYQNAKDLAVMVNFIENNEGVMEQLKVIDFENKKIHFGVFSADECTVAFKRKVVERPFGWVGPAAPLIHDYTLCN
jgi:hypothetical protein